MADDDDEYGFGGLYENGHWIWDDCTEALAYVSDLPPAPIETVQILNKAPTGTVEFRDDVDLIEQIRFRRRYQRKLLPGDADVVTLQDVKDIAIYTAPVNILSPMLINMMHVPTTERFLRALILCCAYHLQVADEMARRIAELDTKVRTPDCEIIEREYRDNLSDLRILVAKEYCVMLLGGADTKNFHHMGPTKRRCSLSDKDSRLFETFLRMSVQIVWIAVGQLEISRLFKSEIFNAVEHNLNSQLISKMSAEERAVLLGRCVRRDTKLNTRSPLMNEVYCHREINCRLMGLGIIKYKDMSRRLNYLWHAVAAKEDLLKDANMSLGIIGMPRSKFDTMLRPIPQLAEKTPSNRQRQSVHSVKPYSAADLQSSSVSKSLVVAERLYPEIVLPAAKPSHERDRPRDFLEHQEATLHINETQRRRWLKRVKKLLKGVK